MGSELITAFYHTIASPDRRTGGLHGEQEAAADCAVMMPWRTSVLTYLELTAMLALSQSLRDPFPV